MTFNRLPFCTQKNTQKIVLFTGVDGTLLDEETFDIEQAINALEYLKQRDIPIIFCSSKTFSEQDYWQKKLHVNAPFIFENGSGIAIPKGYFPDNAYEADGFSGDYDIIILAQTDAFHVKNTLARINRMYGMALKGYSDCMPEEITRLTHLKGDLATRALDRMFTEILVNPVDEKLAQVIGPQLASCGLALGKNARFNSVQSLNVDKGKAVKRLQRIYADTMGAAPVSMAIGDSANDIAMLEAAQIRFLVQRPHGGWAPMDIKGLNRVSAVGPEGFLNAVQLILG
jgi:mannosyl-3-phosphoglycerate phosphatase